MELSRKANSILQCFVDLNLEVNENFPYQAIDLPLVSFSQEFITVLEGEAINFTVRLDAPSKIGIEEADLVLLHETTNEDDLAGTLDFPKKLTWEAGEQEKSFQIIVNTDFLEEETESLVFGLTNLINCTDGNNVQLPVEIVNTTVLKIVSISADNGQLINTGNQAGGQSQFLRFFAIEGEELKIKIALDQPSEFGVEKVDVAFFNADGIANPALANIDFNLLGTTQVSWGIGQQIKEITINTINDNVIEGIERVQIQLVNPKNVKIGNSLINSAQIFIEDKPTGRRYSDINFGRIYRQKGKTPNSNPYVYLRKVPDGQTSVSLFDNWLVEFDSRYIDESFSPDRMDIVNYPSYPNYYFGVNSTGGTGDLVFNAINKGDISVVFNGIEYQVDEPISVVVESMNQVITLPSNANLMSAGTILSATQETLEVDTFIDSIYEFEFLVDHDVFFDTDGNEVGIHGFKLKEGSGEDGKLFNMGQLELKNYPTLFESMSNIQSLYSSYSGTVTTYNGSCVDNFNSLDQIYDMRVRGIIFLDDTNNNSHYYDFKFLPINEFEQTCSIKNGTQGTYSWTSIPFEII